MATFNTKKFNTKADYLAYRKEWKAEYKNLSASIRSNKQEIKQNCRDAGDTGWPPTEPYYTLSSRKGTATLMLAQLAEAKINAQASYLHFKIKDSDFPILQGVKTRILQMCN